MPRKLNYSKCARCRKDKQKCTPVNRSWPDEKCHRCLIYDHSCSANTTIRVPRGTQSEDSPQQGPSTIHASPAHLVLESQSVVDKNLSNVGSYTYNLPQTRPRCASLFSGLLNVSLDDWMRVGSYNIAKESGLNTLLANIDARRSRIDSVKKAEVLRITLRKELHLEVARFPPSDNFRIATLLLFNPEKSIDGSSDLTVGELLTDLKESALLANLWEDICVDFDAILLMDERGSWFSQGNVHVDDIVQNLCENIFTSERSNIPDEELDLMIDTLVELEGLADKIQDLRLHSSLTLRTQLATEVYDQIRTVFGDSMGSSESKANCTIVEDDRYRRSQSSGECSDVLQEDDCRIFDYHELDV